MSLEIVWFRLLGVMLKSTALTFGTLLTIYLTGIGAGAAIGSRLLGRTRDPAHAFLLMQARRDLRRRGHHRAAGDVADWRARVALSAYFGSYEPMDAAPRSGSWPQRSAAAMCRAHS